MPSAQSLTYILRRNAYRDNSLLLDCFSEATGRITLVTRFSKRQSNRVKGMMEPFRLLDTRWTGRGEVLTLNHAEEKRRYSLKGAALIQATYLNELILRLFQPMLPLPELFTRYRQLLHLLQEGGNILALMLFELDALAACGHEFGLWQDDANGQVIQPELNYHFQPERGLFPLRQPASHFELPNNLNAQSGVLISGELLIGLRNPETMADSQWTALRSVLDRMLSLQLAGKTLYARQLLDTSGLN
uniref:DNA repair protein RecO n=1 Tax=uncultured Thiotrichaceae bacterium TaxID=298394 RepID=A0A6S6SYV6_9GAMM|nr:MAG: DNA recombination and repair protein RecO [uncultured Thiotrichaceae bacterium]